MASTQSQGLSDEQVEELLNALLDFRAMLLGLTDRFQSRMALLEQEFEERRTGPLDMSKRPIAGSIRPSAPLTGPLSKMEPEPEPEAFDIETDEVFDASEGEAFSIVDIDDDDDF